MELRTEVTMHSIVEGTVGERHFQSEWEKGIHEHNVNCIHSLPLLYQRLFHSSSAKMEDNTDYTPLSLCPFSDITETDLLEWFDESVCTTANSTDVATGDGMRSPTPLVKRSYNALNSPENSSCATCKKPSN